MCQLAESDKREIRLSRRTGLESNIFVKNSKC